MIRTLKALYQILTGHYVQVALAWVGIFYLLISFGHWLRNRNAYSETEVRRNRDIYVDQLSCLGAFAAGAGLLFLSVLGLVILAAALERVGLHRGFACLSPLLILATFILYKWFRR